MKDVADIWDPKPLKEWHECVACEQLKIIVWLGMCGCCAVEHKRLTVESVETWKAEMEARKQKEAA